MTYNISKVVGWGNGNVLDTLSSTALLEGSGFEFTEREELIAGYRTFFD